MGSGAIYAVIVALWAVVLIPMWLRRHDEANEARSVDRYRGAMRSLSRRSVGSTREVLMPAGDRGAVQISVKGTAEPTEATRRPAPRRTAAASPVPAGVRAARSRAAARRRRVLLALAVLLVVVLGAALLGRVPLWAVAGPVLLIGGFVATARRQMRLKADLDRRLVRGAELRDRAEQVEADLESRPRSQTPARSTDVEAEMAAAAVSDRGDLSWDAVSALLPSYVTAPAASRIPRVIDLTTPGHWTGAAMVEQVRRDRELLTGEPLFDQTIDVTDLVEVPEEATFADRFVDDEVDLQLDDDREFFDQMNASGGFEHRRAVND